ncbi:MAG TPA: hypothetical protein VFN97_25705 [Actinospica sp.]|nr:hypothetical protein [Actinospica sp.]
MNQQNHYSFGYALAAQRQAEFEAAARRRALVRAAKLVRRQARSRGAADDVRARIPQQRGAAQCAADIG